MLTVGSLFSGIGGFDLGLERAGMRTLWFCEQDPFCRRVLARHWPGVPCHPDVRALVADTEAEQRRSGPVVPWPHMVDDGPQPQHGPPRTGDGDGLPVPVPYVDVLCGGFPCQDISLAGRGAGLAGERSGLWREFARLIGELRPRYVLVENVPALTARGLRRRPCGPCRARVRCGMGPSTSVGLWRPSPDATASGSWPTPNQADGLGGRISSDETIMRGERPSGAKVQVTLREAIRRREIEETWPTPTARLGAQRGAQAKRYHDPARSNDLDDAVAARGTAGQLNPTWVEWLMGFPPGWTDSGPSATASSPRSRSGSADRSSNGRS